MIVQEGSRVYDAKFRLIIYDGHNNASAVTRLVKAQITSYPSRIHQDLDLARREIEEKNRLGTQSRLRVKLVEFSKKESD